MHRSRSLYGLIAALLMTAGMLAPAGADGRRARPGLESQVTLDAVALAGFAAGTLSQYAETTWVQIRLQNHLGQSHEAAAEWELIAHATNDCSAPLVVLFFGNPPDQYGPRVHERVNLPLDAVVAVELIHEGPLSDHGQTSSGRHHLACATI